jgi:transposase-like protein
MDDAPRTRGAVAVLSQILGRRRLAVSLSSADSEGQQVSIGFKGSHFERDVIPWGVRWYVAFPISYRQLEEMMEERGVEVDHSTLNRWVLKYAPLLEREFHARKRSVGRSWRMDKTYMKVKGVWKYLYRAVVDKAGATVDFLLTPSGTIGCASLPAQGIQSTWHA